MHRVLILICVVVLFFTLAPGLSAELAEGNKRFAIEFSVLPLFVTTLHVSFHIAISDIISIPIYYTGVFPPVLTLYAVNMVSTGARIYPGKKAHGGFYIAPLLSLLIRGDITGHFGYGVELGYMADIGKSWFFDVGFGLLRFKKDIIHDISHSFFEDFLPVFNLGFGFKF